MEIVRTYALSMLHTPYISGGNNCIQTSGIDCSGLVCEILRAFGKIGRDDNTAQMLYDRFVHDGPHGVFGIGVLSFYGKSLKDISHVGFGIDQYTMIEAGGGDANTKTIEEAILKNAFVRLRPYKYRKDWLDTIKLNWATIGYV